MVGATGRPGGMARSHSHGISRRAVGLALVMAFLCLDMSANFLMTGTGSVLKASNGLDGMEVRSERTVMRAKKVETEFPETPHESRQQILRNKAVPGGRSAFRIARKPVLAYAVAERKDNGQIGENAASVLRRLREMWDQDYCIRQWDRQRYFHRIPRKAMYDKSYAVRLMTKAKRRRLKDSFDEAWKQWMVTSGRRLNLNQAVVYEGPKLAWMLTEEMDKKTEPKEVMKSMPTKEELYLDMSKKRTYAKMGVPQDMLPGNWNTDGEDNIHKVWKRPLHKHIYDIPKYKKQGWVINRGIVF